MRRINGAPVGRLVQRLIRSERHAYTLTAAGWILWHLWPLMPGLLAQAFFNVLAGQTPAGLNFPSVIALITVTGLFRAGVMWGAVVKGVGMRFRQKTRLALNLLERILTRPAADGLSMPTPDVLTTFREDVDALALAVDWPFDVVAAMLFFILGLAILLNVDWQLTLWVFMPVGLVLGVTHSAQSRLTRLHAENRAATARATGATMALLSAREAIRGRGAEEDVLRWFNRLGRARQTADLHDVVQATLLEAVFQRTAGLGTGLILILAASAMRAHTFTVGDFALFATYLQQVGRVTGFLGYLVVSFRDAAVSAERAGALADSPPYVLATDPVGPLTLHSDTVEPLRRFTVKGLPCRSGESPRVSFHCRRGTLTMLTGPVGSGKTTVLRRILGLLADEEGVVAWNGRVIANRAKTLTPPRAAWVPQVGRVMQGSLRDNVLLGRTHLAGRLPEALWRAVLTEDVERMPGGAGTDVGAGGSRLSGGQLQRVAVARAVIARPELLVVDDMTSALDLGTERVLWNRVRATGTTILAVAHRSEILAWADQVVELSAGKDPRVHVHRRSP